MSYINKIKQGTEEYDIRSELEVVNATASLTWNNNTRGTISFEEAPESDIFVLKVHETDGDINYSIVMTKGEEDTAIPYFFYYGTIHYGYDPLSNAVLKREVFITLPHDELDGELIFIDSSLKLDTDSNLNL